MAKPNEDKTLDLLNRLSLSAWELEKAKDAAGDDPGHRAIELQAHKQLQEEIEELNLIGPSSRSSLLIQEKVTESVLLVHGSTGNPSDIESLTNYLYDNGFTVCSMLLPGHGVDGTVRPDVKWKSCLAEVRLRHRILDRVSSKVHVVGFSFGAALALLLAAETKLPALVLLAPALDPRLPFMHKLLITFNLHKLPFIRRRVGWDLEVFEAMEKARGLVGKLKLPIYAAHCEDDELIDASSLRHLQKKAKHGASRFRLYETGGHMITQAHGEDSLHEEVLDFLRGPKNR